MLKTLDELKEEFQGECLTYIKFGQQFYPQRVHEIIERLVEQANKEIDEQNEAAYSLLVRNKELQERLTQSNYEERIPNDTYVKEIRTGKIYKVIDAIKTNNQFGYGIYLYRFEGRIDTGFGLYRSEIEIIEKYTKVISGFPGVGKSVLFNQSNLSVLDSDSSLFSWISEGVRHPDFPNNYIQHIKENIGKVDYIFVSSHDIVREALKENNIEYTLIYPSIELKDEYIERYKNRGNNDGFIKFISLKWDEFINDIEKEIFPKLIKLNSGQYLSDVLENIE